MWTSDQLAAALSNREKTRRYEERLANDPEFAALVEKESADYEAFCKIHGGMDR